MFARLFLAFVFLVGSNAAAQSEIPQAGCLLTKIGVLQDEAGSHIRVETTGTPAFTVFRMEDPTRLVLDITGADTGKLRGPIIVENGGIMQVAVHQYDTDGHKIGRIVVGIDCTLKSYNARADGTAIILDVVPQVSHGQNAQPVTPLSPDPEDAKGPTASTPNDKLPSVAALPQAPIDGGVDNAPEAVDDQPVGEAQTRSQPPLFLPWATNAQIRTFVATFLEAPPRLVIDLKGQKPNIGRVKTAAHRRWLKGMRTGRHAGMLRVVLDLRPGARAHVTRIKHGLRITPYVAPKNALQKLGDAGVARVHKLVFATSQILGRNQSRIGLNMSGWLHATPTVDTTNPKAWLMKVPYATLVGDKAQSLNTQDAPGNVVLVSAYQATPEDANAPPEVHVVANLNGEATQSLQKGPKGWSWHIDDRQDTADTQLSAKGYTKPQKRITIDVKDADILNVLRLISDETGENIIASDEVHGRVTLRLRNVPADQALDTILRTKGFDRVRQNNILRIATAETIQKERDNELAKRRAINEVEDTVIKMVTINYASASEVVEQMRPMLSGRGTVQVDHRTNTLILQDIGSNIERLVELARRLDKQTPLVNIQARIVEASSSHVRDLGVQWGGTSQSTQRSGNPTGLYFPADVTVGGAADDPARNQTGGLATPTRYAVNLPATLSGAGGGLGFVLGSAGGSQVLDLRLTAMETNGTGKIISSPEVSTLDNKTARVSQGTEIPISVVSAAGTNTKFVPAVLELEVTPHVTNDGTVLLRIKVQKSQPDFSKLGGQGDPTIQKKQAETEVLVRDGDTSVIGGIYTREESTALSEVPFFARIPLLGYLFREKSTRDLRSELLVFITPKIINRDESQMRAGTMFKEGQSQRQGP